MQKHCSPPDPAMIMERVTSGEMTIEPEFRNRKGGQPKSSHRSAAFTPLHRPDGFERA
jgi:hypothetical protein